MIIDRAKSRVEKIEITAEILADSLHDLNPAVSKEDWLKHVQQTAGNPKAFFQGNGQGLSEYLAFVAKFDKDKRQRALKVKRR